MSTDHHPSDPPRRDERPPSGETRYVDWPPSALEQGVRDARAPTDFEDAPTDFEDARIGLETRIERARLRVRIAALERSLAEQERRRRAVIDQYERILEEHPSEYRGSIASAGPNESADSSASPRPSETIDSTESTNSAVSFRRTVSPRLKDAIVPTEREPARTDPSTGDAAGRDGPLARLLRPLVSLRR